MKINFIPDEVLKLTDDTDLLGTKPYSDTIFEIVNNCSGSKNIGLFGSWGSGKSTILTTLENLIDEHNAIKTEKIAYFEFDAWKYSKDDFRRSFLIELTKKFSIKTQSKLEKLLYSESSFENPKQTKFRINWLSLPDWLILALVVFAFVFFFLPTVGMGDRTKALIALITISVSLLTKAASNTVNKYKVVVKENKLVEPERFEAVFDEIISELTTNSTNKVYHWIQKLIGRTKHSKVVIVIDNLDRCDDENLLLTLNTVKNFLEHQKVIFILPVDEKGISSFLSQKTDNADEYLRKIFHLILRLKAFSNKELTEFTNSVNKKYELGLNSSSIRIICQEFTNNPRKVIQFLNNYQSEMWLIKEQSKKGYINGDFIKENLSFFIKLLIIKYEWKNLYDGILYDKTLLNKINDVITNLKPDDGGLYQIEKTKVRLTDTQRNFLFSTQDIHCTKIDPFILNIDLDKEIPDDIENYIRLGYYEAIANYLDDSNTPFDEKTLIKKIDEVFSDLTYKHQEYEFIALPVLQLLIEFVLDKKQEKFRKLLIENHSEYPFLKSLFKDARLLNLFEKLDFEKVVDGTKWFFDNISSNLFHSFIGYLKTKYLGSSTMDNENDRINYFIDAFKDTGKLSLIKREFSNKLSGKPEGVSSIESLKDYKIASQLISIPTYKSLAKKLNEKESKWNYLTSSLCFDYSVNNKKDKITKEHLVRYYLSDLEAYFNAESISQDDYDDYLEHFSRLNKVLD
ncbi:P-loop NTPase fold protein, partial [Allomuricauda sp. CP2A]|uniref:KAP family P-loop NTPase fold protein n=1 Tax=Allomuricauda sp. CP2A TaxID=1848189 RepID=UPI000A9ED629